MVTTVQIEPDKLRNIYFQHARGHVTAFIDPTKIPNDGTDAAYKKIRRAEIHIDQVRITRSLVFQRHLVPASVLKKINAMADGPDRRMQAAKVRESYTNMIGPRELDPHNPDDFKLIVKYHEQRLASRIKQESFDKVHRIRTRGSEDAAMNLALELSRRNEELSRERDKPKRTRKAKVAQVA